jgi:protein-S-isoprenylcysteine O-methyltransferase Ste14
VNQATAIILLHQLLFQGMFAAKNVVLRRRLGQSIRGRNREADRAVAFFALFIALSLALAWSGSAVGSVRLLPDVAATGLCLLLLALNLAIGAASLRDLGDSWRVGVIEAQQTDLVVDGIYGATRNPYFTAYLLMFAAYTVLLQNTLLLALSCIGFGLVHAMVLKEEAYLESVHGEIYRDYRARVPRYLFRRFR